MKLEDAHILVVEDHPQTTRLIRMMLLDMGVANVIATKDGIEAKELLDEGDDRVDAVLCDWRMPRMTGIQLLKEVRKTNPKLPFMMVTANADVESIKAAASSGVSGYIAKPFSPAQLKKKLVALLEAI